MHKVGLGDVLLDLGLAAAEFAAMGFMFAIGWRAANALMGG